MFVSAAIEVMTVIYGEGTKPYSSQSPTIMLGIIIVNILLVSRPLVHSGWR